MLRQSTLLRVACLVAAIGLPFLLVGFGFAYLPALMQAMGDQVGMELTPWMFLGTYVGVAIQAFLWSWATITGKSYWDLVTVPDAE